MKATFLRQRRYQTIMLVILVSIISRVVVSLNVDALAWRDSQRYIAIADSLVSGQGYGSDAYSAPLYPLFIAAIYRLLGSKNIFVQLVQSLLGMIACLLLYAIGKILFNEKAGLLAAALAAIYPFLVYISSLILTEQLFIVMLLLAIYLLVMGKGECRYLFILGAGISLGLGALTRPAMLIFVPFCALYLLVSGREIRLKKRLMAACIILVGIFLTISPWTIRNYIKHRQFILISTAGGFNLWLGNNELAGGSDTTATLAARSIENPLQLSRKSTADSYREMAFRWIRGNPAKFVALYFSKFLNFWRVTPDHVTNIYKHKLIRFGCIAILVPLYFLSVTGIWRNRHRWREHLILYFALFSFPIGLSLFVTSFRFRITLDPILLLFSAPALYYVIPHKSGDRQDTLQKRVIPDVQSC